MSIPDCRADAVLFDKDGTLFEFNATWGGWAANVIADLSGGNAAQAARIAEEIDFDLAAGRFRPSSPVIAGTSLAAAAAVQRAMPQRKLAVLAAYLDEAAADMALAPAVPLAGFLDRLAARGLRLGVVTNDSESVARRNLQAAGVLEQFDFIAGFDSGFGAKPDPAPLLAFARAVKLPASRVVMVGDSRHDLIAGRAAGMQAVGVLTGLAGREELALLADAVFPDIGHLHAWLNA